MKFISFLYYFNYFNIKTILISSFQLQILIKIYNIKKVEIINYNNIIKKLILFKNNKSFTKLEIFKFLKKSNFLTFNTKLDFI